MVSQPSSHGDDRSREYVVKDGVAMAANLVETVKADSPRHEKGR